MTRIGIDVRWLHGGLTHDAEVQMLGGIGSYARHVLPRLVAAHPDVQFVLFHLRERPLDRLCKVFSDSSNVTLMPLPLQAGSRVADPILGQIKRYFQDRYVIRKLVRMARVDLFHSISQFVPAYDAPGMKRVVTVHDIIPVAFPTSPWSPTAYAWRLRLRDIARYDAVITDSDHTQQDVIQLLGVEPSRAVTVHLGVDDEYHADTVDDQTAPLLTAHGISGRYLLYVGGLQRNKNVNRLLHAFASVLTTCQEELVLVMVGAEQRFYPRQAAELQRQLELLNLQGKVRLLPWLPADNLRAVYRGALALVLPSLYEGFGLPALEAMASGTVVITSGSTSIPEVVGDAGVYVDGHQYLSIADGIRCILADPALREELQAKGKKRSRQFTWDRTAEGHWRVYDAVLSGRKVGSV